MGDGLARLLADESFRHSWDMSDERKIDGAWVQGLCCDCGEFVPYGEEVDHFTAAFATVLDAWLETVAGDAAVRESVCESMHDAYERAATENGWETQERSRKPWADVPDANKATMRVAVDAAVAALLAAVRAA